MTEQPGVLAALLARRDAVVHDVQAALPHPLAGVVLLARGSSDNAAIYGRYLLELGTRRPVSLAAPSLHTIYGGRPDVRGYLVVATSQSGETPEIVDVFTRLREVGARGIAITNDPRAPLAQAADAVIELGAGDERAVPATKTFSAQLAAFALVAEAAGDVPWSDGDLERVPESVAGVLADPEPARRCAATLADAGGLFAVGRGFLFAVALEAALKLKEAALVLAEGASAADLRHGPIAVVERDFPVLCLSAAGPAAADMAALVEELRARRAHVVRIADDPAAELGLDSVPAEALAPFPATVRAQQLALELALARGLDPDAPEGLSKVTQTR